MNDGGNVVGGSWVDVDDMTLRIEFNKMILISNYTISIGKGLDSIGTHHALDVVGR